MEQKIKEILHSYKKKRIENEKLVPSAVLIPLFYREGQLHILFTKRSSQVNFHKGQVCFPGGTCQPGDASLLGTALREASEEVGLEAKDLEILGELDDVATLTTNYLISPFVAFIPYPYPFKANQKEVEEIFSIPLSAFLEDKANFRQDYQAIDGETSSAYEYEGHIIWGATAKILMQFIALLKLLALRGTNSGN